MKAINETGCCQMCGKKMPEGTSHLRQFCEVCRRERAIMRKRDQRATEKKIREERRVAASEPERVKKISPRPVIKSIEQVVREANAAKMSYGQYVAQMRR